MKRRITVITTIAASLLLSALTILAAENCPIPSGEFDKLVQSNFKNQCLIVAKNCSSETATVQQRLDELRVEIAKGRTVYNADELRMMREQLGWIERDSGNQII